MMLRVFTKETLVEGQPSRVSCVEVAGQIYSVGGGSGVRILRLEDEWFEDVADPATVIETLRSGPGFKPDIFTFCQRMPDTAPRYDFYYEWDSIAVLPVKTFEHWFTKQIKGVTRNMIRKSQKAGLQVREAAYDDEFARGMTDVFNETRVRQGKRFWHYGKNSNTIKQQFSRYLYRETLIGAYLGSELAGFVMLGDAGKYAVLGQFISKLKYRDKATNNALIAKSVEVCEQKGWPYLIYGYWSHSSLVDFKRHSGFEEVRIPRYFVPLTAKGRLALKLDLHRGWTAAVPPPIMDSLKHVRSLWYAVRDRSQVVRSVPPRA